MARYVANPQTRTIHDVELQTSHCGLHSLSADDQLLIDDDSQVKLMVELEGFSPCPECMGSFRWA